ncbi:MAG: hypothetical protein NDI66_06635 [Pseudomonas sp.]|nr:hypothetical protein [Pseudomonas sp.]
MPTLDALQAPNLNLSITEHNGRLVVGLDLPATSGSARQIPFLEVTRNESRALLAEAQQTVIARLSQSGFQVGEINLEASRGQNAALGAAVPRVGRLQFEITGEQSASGTIRNNPDVAGAIRAAEGGFDRSRQALYEQRARNWAEDGGARVRSGDQVYTVTPQAAADYYNDQRWFPWEKIRPAQPRAEMRDGIGTAYAATADDGLRHPGHPYHRQFEQALRGLDGTAVPHRTDAAALLVQAGANAGFDRNGALAVVAGTRDNVFAVQGDGPAGLRAAVAHADIQPGAFARVSEALGQQAMAQAPAQPAVEEQVRARAV